MCRLRQKWQTTEIRRIFKQPINVLISKLENTIGSDAKSFYKLHEVLNLKSHDSSSKSLLENLTSKLSEIKNLHASSVKFLNKLKVIIESVDDYLSNSLNIRHYAPWRQSQIVIHCNARCIQCVGLYSKSISQGELADGKLKKFMTLKEATSSFKNIEDIVVFNMTGSELFFSKDWKVICTELRSNEVFIRNTTNGMILTKENIEFIVDNNLIQNLDISIDGALKKTFESIRVNVKYDKFIESINYLFFYIKKRKLAMDIGFNFCLMVDNWQELAMIPKIINKARGSEWLYGKVQLNVLVIDTRGEDSYLNFAKDHHHSLIPRNQFIEAVQRTKEECDLFKINFVWSYNEKIDEFIHRGAPQEGYENLSFVRIHLDSHLDEVDITADFSLKFIGWVLSPNDINNISVRLNSKEVDYSYGRECQWLIEQYPSLKSTHCGLDFQIPHDLLVHGTNLLEIEAIDKEGFRNSKYVFLNKKAQ